jgi:hypothetical protein
VEEIIKPVPRLTYEVLPLEAIIRTVADFSLLRIAADSCVALEVVGIQKMPVDKVINIISLIAAIQFLE